MQTFSKGRASTNSRINPNSQEAGTEECLMDLAHLLTSRNINGLDSSSMETQRVSLQS